MYPLIAPARADLNARVLSMQAYRVSTRTSNGLMVTRVVGRDRNVRRPASAIGLKQRHAVL